MELTPQQKKALKRLKVRSFRKDMRRLSPEQLRKEFSAKSSGRILLTPLVRNLVFQAASWMIDGKIPKVEGNLRSLFYQWIKPVVARLPSLSSRRVDPYDVMLDVLETFVVSLRLFRYRDLELVDENWENCWFSDGRNPHILLFAEKTGFVMFLQQASKKYGINSVALGGSPSHLSTEYLVERMREKLDNIEPLVLFSITDHDPSGFFIARAFQMQLENQYVPIIGYHKLIEPAHYTEDELQMFHFPIPSKYRARIESWMETEGGIGGEPLGLEADSLPKARLRQVLDEHLQPYLRG